MMKRTLFALVAALILTGCAPSSAGSTEDSDGTLLGASRCQTLDARYAEFTDALTGFSDGTYLKPEATGILLSAALGMGDAASLAEPEYPGAAALMRSASRDIRKVRVALITDENLEKPALSFIETMTELLDTYC